MDLALIVAFISAAAAAGAALWARESARAAHRAARAAERSADADERSARSAEVALMLEGSQAAIALHREHGAIAPILGIQATGEYEFLLAESGVLLGEVLNRGPGDAVIESAIIELPGGRPYAGLEEPTRRLAPREGIQLQFRDPELLKVAPLATGLVLVVEYRAADTPYRACARWNVFRNGSDRIRDRPIWSTRPAGVDRLDRPLPPSVRAAVDRDQVVAAVEQTLRRAFASSAPATDAEWRADAEMVADAALAALEHRRASQLEAT